MSDLGLWLPTRDKTNRFKKWQQVRGKPSWSSENHKLQQNITCIQTMFQSVFSYLPGQFLVSCLQSIPILYENMPVILFLLTLNYHWLQVNFGGGSNRWLKKSRFLKYTHVFRNTPKLLPTPTTALPPSSLLHFAYLYYNHFQHKKFNIKDICIASI